MKVYIGKYPNTTWLSRLTFGLLEPKKQKKKIKIDPYDLWSLDSVLGDVIVEALKAFRDNPNNYLMFFYDNEDVPLEHHHPEQKNDSGTYNNFTDEQWMAANKWIISEMILGFVEPDEWATENSTVEYIPNDLPLMEDIRVANKAHYDEHLRLLREFDEKSVNGRKLFAKYYRSLWT